MAKKTLINHLETLVAPDDNFFSLPQQFRGAKTPSVKPFAASGLKPNTRYKIMLNNYPGRAFEDITNFCRPVGSSIINNTRDTRDPARNYAWDYFTTDAEGKLEIELFTYGANYADITNGVPSYVNLWKLNSTRTAASDNDRGKINIIEYSKVNDRDTDERVKTINFDIDQIERRETASGLFVSNNNSRPGAGVEGAVLPAEPDVKGKDVNYRVGTFNASFYQTFFIDPLIVDSSETVDLANIQLYLRRKPNKKYNTSGQFNPGIKICIMDVIM